MEQLKKLGDICRKHYEKLILILALLLLAGAVLYLAAESEKEKEQLKEMQVKLTRRAVKGVPPVNLSRYTEAIKLMTNPPALNLSGPHNLFNPVKWQQNRNTGAPEPIRRGDEAGVGNLQVVRIRPLHYSVAFGRAATSGAGDQTVVIGYQMFTTNELVLRGGRPEFKSPFMNVNETNKPALVLLEVKGDPQAPTELIVALKDFNNERVTFAPGRPYLRPIGYEAELKYPFANKNYQSLRIGNTMEVDNEPYKIVDITSGKVVLFDDSNGKRYTIERTAPQ